ncbi:MAG TPA: outer membrane beta-barrel protein [Anaeromyxobacter sp.]|nr:outer membrane beta-barrel protein [Anaeromyxobacter sp.]
MHYRTPIALAVAALLAAPLTASAQASKKGTRASTTRAAGTATAPGDGLSVGGFIGYEGGDLSGLTLRADAELPFQQLSPQVKLSLVGSLGYTHFGKDIDAPGLSGDITFNVVHAIPAARFTLPINPQIDLYGDAGLGLYFYHFTTKQTVFGVPAATHVSGSGLGLLMRIAVGGFYRVSPQLRVGAEVGVLPYFNKIDTTDWTLLVGAMFAL